MQFYIALGFFSFLLFLPDATAFAGIGRKFFGSETNNENEPETRDAVLAIDQHSVDDGNLIKREENGEPSATANLVLENQIPPTILRKIRQQYGDIDPQVLASIARNPQAAASEIDSTTGMEARGKLKKLTGIAFILALLKIIF